MNLEKKLMGLFDCCDEPNLHWFKKYSVVRCRCGQKYYRNLNDNTFYKQRYYFYDGEYHILMDKLEYGDVSDNVICPYCEATNKKPYHEDNYYHCYVCKAKLYR